MKKLKVLVADSQVVVRQQLLQELNKDTHIEVVGAVGDGREAYEIFEREEPNVVIFDLLLPIYDGYALLEKMNEHGIGNGQELIMTTPLTSDLLVSEAFRQGVDYVLTKPYDASLAVGKIKRIHEKINKVRNMPSVGAGLTYRKVTGMESMKTYGMQGIESVYQKLDEIISKSLNEIGIPARLKGYRYLTTAIKEVLKNDEVLDAVTKILYPDIAKKRNSTAQRVEKAIRHAIEVAWSSGENNSSQMPYQYIIRAGKSRPTNSEFIAKLAQDIKLECQKQVVAC